MSVQQYVPERFVATSILGVPVKVRRVPVQLSNDYGNAGPSSNLIQFTLPSSQILDFGRGYLRFTASCSQTGGTYCRFSDNIATVINRATIQVGSVIGQDSPQYDLWQNIPAQTFADPLYASSVGYMMQGFGSQTQRNTWGAGNQYVIPIQFGMLAASPLLLPLMSQQVLLRLYVNNSQNVLESDGTSATYSLTNIALSLDSFEFPSGSSYLADLRSKLNNEGKLEISYQQYDHGNFNITGAGQQSIQLPVKKSSVRAFIGIMRDSATINSLSTQNKFESYNYNAAQTAYFTVNNIQFPQKQIDLAGSVATGGLAPEPFFYALQVLRGWNGYSNIVTSTAVAQNFYAAEGLFVLAYDFGSFDAPGSGLDTNASFSIFTLTLNLGTVSQPQTLEWYVTSDAIWVIKANGTSEFIW